MRKINAGVLGATGMVGQRIIDMLIKHPWFNLELVSASERSVGKKYIEATNWVLSSDPPEELSEYTVIEQNPKLFEKEGAVKIVFSALPSNVAKKAEAEFAKAGFAVSSNASAYRMDDDVPLLIPEVNSDHIKLINFQREKRGWDGLIITDPNCSTIVLSLALKPLDDTFGLKSVFVTTMQALSGAGLDGVSAMAIYDNIIPFIAGEEDKIEKETKKILGSMSENKITPARFTVFASCHRVLTLEGHLESVFAIFENDASIEEAKKILKSFRGIPQKYNFPTAPKQPIIVREEPNRPQPRIDRDAELGMSISVGRLRCDPENSKILRFIVLGHNTIRGAAGATLLNAELLVHMKYI